MTDTQTDRTPTGTCGRIDTRHAREVTHTDLHTGDIVLVQQMGKREYMLGTILYDMGMTVSYIDIAQHQHIAYKRHTVLLKRHHTCYG